MKRPTRKAALRGALEFIAAHPDGCTEAILAAENIPASILIELVRGGLVVARQETFENEDGTTEVTRVWNSEAGQLALAAAKPQQVPTVMHGHETINTVS